MEDGYWDICPLVCCDQVFTTRFLEYYGLRCMDGSRKGSDIGTSSTCLCELVMRMDFWGVCICVMRGKVKKGARYCDT